MAKPAKLPYRRWPKPIRIVLVRPRLFVSLLIGTIAALMLSKALPGQDWLHWLTSGLLGWDISLGLYLALTYWMFAHADIAHIRRHSALQDEGGFAILILTVAVTAASFGAMFVWLELASRIAGFGALSLALVFVTIVLSWAFIHTIFALHYAHEYYAERRGSGGGLIFPRDKAPNYWDFVYFAFGLGTATQVSDVQVSSKTIRRTVMAHGIVAFFFNVTIIALTVGLAGDVIQIRP
jgi:uncharacterized membrane protein